VPDSSWPSCGVPPDSFTVEARVLLPYDN